ncbi:MAG TPA: hypothetical protein VE223_08340 [Nitrososphaeraceae archaeon]|nr:hypothetical protein [Nitrososphaeraceae archaeon]
MAETQAITQFYCPVGSGKTVTVYVELQKQNSDCKVTHLYVESKFGQKESLKLQEQKVAS